MQHRGKEARVKVALGHFEVVKGGLTFRAGPRKSARQSHFALNLRKVSLFSVHLPQLKFAGIILVAVSAQANLKLNNSIDARLSLVPSSSICSRVAFWTALRAPIISIRI